MLFEGEIAILIVKLDQKLLVEDRIKQLNNKFGKKAYNKQGKTPRIPRHDN